MENDKTLEDIKRLLILLLIKLDATSDEIGLALNAEASGIRKMMPFRQIKRIAKAVEDK